jgi:hypothetical protein
MEFVPSSLRAGLCSQWMRPLGTTEEYPYAHVGGALQQERSCRHGGSPESYFPPTGITPK